MCCNIRELKQETFFITRTSTGSKFDVFDQSRCLLQSLWRPCCQKTSLAEALYYHRILTYIYPCRKSSLLFFAYALFVIAPPPGNTHNIDFPGVTASV